MQVLAFLLSGAVNREVLSHDQQKDDQNDVCMMLSFSLLFTNILFKSCH